ncbi:hypothetical protein [Chryseobacterium indologenes]|uniref:hypothetical protein n=1 Tax=Chryseobacterium indologenes TaxID=253 RepID=UPI0006455951|nr:hypothetical protein [Chryseobacterium indologenes]
MSTKILCWNIERFGSQTLLNSYAREPSTLQRYRRDYILSNCYMLDPDIFIVIEVVTNKGLAGSLIPYGRSAYTGLTMILDRLKRLNTNWCLVPPLRLNENLQDKFSSYSESIGVFFRNDRLDFIGPYIWPADHHHEAKTSKREGSVNRGPYPPGFDDFLPDRNYFAAKVEFHDKNNQLITFPDAPSRRPYLTRFHERQGEYRNISLFNIHLPVIPDIAETALKRLLKHIDQEPAYNNDIKVIAGDLNIDLAENFGLNGQISDLGYKIGINPRSHEKDKIKTTFKKRNEAIPLIPPLISGYTTSFVDNFIIKGTLNHNPSILSKTINRVFTGTDKRMHDTLEDIMRIGDIHARYEKFRNYENYGHIRHTSDHMPILLEI